MTTYDEWREARADADRQRAEQATEQQLAAVVTNLGPGLWMVSVAGTTRGFVAHVRVRAETRFKATLRHLVPGQGRSIGEYWEFERAVLAIQAEPPAFLGRDPFAELVRYASRDQMQARTERQAERRRAGRYR